MPVETTSPWDGQNHPTWTAADENDSTTVAAFAKAALAWAKQKGIQSAGTQEGNGSSITFSNLDLGYYLVDSSLGALCGLNTTNPDATIKEKNEKPEIKKEVQTSAGDWGSENNAKIGDIVEYKVEIKVADGAQKYTVTDTMSKGLTFNNSSLKVTANDAVTTDYTLTSTTNGFTLVLPETYVSTLTKGTTIIVTYNATLNKVLSLMAVATPRGQAELRQSSEHCSQQGHHQVLPVRPGEGGRHHQQAAGRC